MQLYWWDRPVREVSDWRCWCSLSILLMRLEAFVDSVDQNQTAKNVQSDLWSTFSTILFWVKMPGQPFYLAAGLCICEHCKKVVIYRRAWAKIVFVGKFCISKKKSTSSHAMIRLEKLESRLCQIRHDSIWPGRIRISLWSLDETMPCFLCVCKKFQIFCLYLIDLGDDRGVL